MLFIPFVSGVSLRYRTERLPEFNEPNNTPQLPTPPPYYITYKNHKDSLLTEVGTRPPDTLSLTFPSPTQISRRALLT